MKIAGCLDIKYKAFGKLKYDIIVKSLVLSLDRLCLLLRDRRDELIVLYKAMHILRSMSSW